MGGVVERTRADQAHHHVVVEGDKATTVHCIVFHEKSSVLLYLFQLFWTSCKILLKT